MVSQRSPARMTRLVPQWRASGESGARFARRHHVPPWTFWSWCRKLQAQPRTASDDTPTFVPVRVTAEADAPVIEVVWTGGERLHIRPGAPTDLVRAIVAALRSPC